MNTDWYNDPGKIPLFNDTQKFVWAIRQQMSMTFKQTVTDIEAEQDLRNSQADQEIRDEIGEAMPAFANPTPGKRGGSVSLPSTRHN